MTLPYSLDADGATLLLRVSPKASRTGCTGIVALADGGQALALRIAAPPVDGAANAEVVRFVAKALGVARTRVAIIAGDTARLKRVRVRGDPDRLAAALAALATG